MFRNFIFSFALFFLIFGVAAIAQEEIKGKLPKKKKVKKSQIQTEEVSVQPETDSKEEKVKKEKKEKIKKISEKPVLKPKIPPPGTVRLNDSVYIDVSPITNAEYREFFHFLLATYSKQVRDSLDNLPKWGVDLENFKKFLKSAGNDKELAWLMRIRRDQILSWLQSIDEYLDSPVFRDNPVIYISYLQANEYALWRTRMVMLNWASKSKNEKQRAKYYTRIQYRLPTPEEWDEAMDKFSENVILNKSIFPYNIACTLPIIGQKRKMDFYYVPGNVSEMTSIENLAVGISWKDSDTIIDYTKRIEYFAPRDWLGFRCVCEIIEY